MGKLWESSHEFPLMAYLFKDIPMGICPWEYFLMGMLMQIGTELGYIRMKIFHGNAKICLHGNLAIWMELQGGKKWGPNMFRMWCLPFLPNAYQVYPPFYAPMHWWTRAREPHLVDCTVKYNVGPPFDSSVGAHNSNVTMVYGTQITN